MSASQAPTAPPAVAVGTATITATAVATAANSMHHCGGVDIHCHWGSTKYNEILDKKPEKRNKTYLVGAQDVSHLEPLLPLLSPHLPCPGGGVFVIAVVVHAHIV